MRRAAESASIDEQKAALMGGFHPMVGHMPQLPRAGLSECNRLRLAAEMQFHYSWASTGKKRTDGGDMEAVIRQLGDLKFEAVARGHKVLCDQPPENGGSDVGMTPPEFLLVSLGTCAAYYAVQYLRTRGMSTDQLTVRVSAEKASQPARFASFVIDVEMPDLDSKHSDGLRRAVKSCLIHNTLCHPPAINLRVHTTALALA
jgi:uncharacterized OsmC-like protein